MVPKTCTFPECEKRHAAKGLCNTHYRRWERHGDAAATSRIVGNDTARFWSKVNKTEACWNWTGALTDRGYGSLRVSGRLRPAHVISYEIANKQGPGSLEVDHMCHNRACVNPGHLRLVTKKQNRENLSGATSVSSTGVRGVHWIEERGEWRAKVGHHGRQFHVGYFATIAEAEAAAIAKRNELFTHNLLDRIPA